MRNGYKVYDSDTHVNPVAEVLERYVDSAFRARLPELEPYKVPAGQPADGEPQKHVYRVGTKLYKRILGKAGPDDQFTGRSTAWGAPNNPGQG